MTFKFIFCFKRMKAIQAIKITLIFNNILRNNADKFFLHKLLFFVCNHLENYFFFSQFELIFEI